MHSLQISTLGITYYGLPCLAVLFAAAVYLTTRTIAPARIWLIAAVNAVVLTVGVTFVMMSDFRGIVPVRTILEMYAVLYAVPFLALTGAALWLRTTVRNRALGVLILVALFIMTSAVAVPLAGQILGIVHAEG